MGYSYNFYTQISVLCSIIFFGFKSGGLYDPHYNSALMIPAIDYPCIPWLKFDIGQPDLCNIHSKTITQILMHHEVK